MFEKSQKHEALATLKSEVKSRASESREVHALIRAASGLERHELRMRKRGIGEGTRARLLASAWLRGRPYLSVEPRCNREALYGVLYQVKVRLAAVLGESIPADLYQQLQAWSAAPAPAQQAAE